MALGPDTPLYNSRIIGLFVKLLREKYPQVDIGELLNHACMKKWEVADPGHWFSQRQIDLFTEKLALMTGDPRIAREAGRYAASPEGLGSLHAFVLGLVGPEYLFFVMHKLARKFTRSSRCSSRRIGPREIEVTVTFEPGVSENPFQCDNRIGYFEAAFLLFGYDFPRIRHTECIFKGGEVCRYNISWNPSLISRLIVARRISLLLLPLSSLSFFFLGGQFFTPALTLALFVYLLFTLLLHGQERKALLSSLTSMRNSTDKLLIQTQDNCDNAQMINEIGEVLSTRTDLDDILKSVNQVLLKRLDYGRGIIFLFDQDREALVLKGCFGFSEEHRLKLAQMVLPIASSTPHGVLVRCFLQQEPLLVNDLSEVKARASAENYAFFVGLGVKSFICAPIVCEGESLGVFAVDDMKRGGELLQSDLNLIQGIAPVIGIAIRNAMHLANERRLSEQLRKASELLERRVDERTSELSHANQELEFLYDSVSHDLRTPIRVIYGYGELLLESYGPQLDDNAKEYLQCIISGGERMEATLDRMLDLSEIRQAQLDLQPVDLSRIAHGIMADLRIVDYKRALTVEIQEGVVVTGDEKLLTRVLENLLGNAWKYTAGKDESAISFGMRDGVCYVADNGDGFDMAQAERLFLPFQRLHGDSEISGHGFGLSIVRKMIERMGGQVWGEGKPGGGATFYFTLPGAATTSALPPQAPADAGEPAAI
uniref:histidine kinase n=1 Tax=Geobacter sp. (strain M21) TaxID=443144 RepID=C6E9C5_GEOSM